MQVRKASVPAHQQNAPEWLAAARHHRVGQGRMLRTAWHKRRRQQFHLVGSQTAVQRLQQGYPALKGRRTSGWPTISLGWALGALKGLPRR